MGNRYAKRVAIRAYNRDVKIRSYGSENGYAWIKTDDLYIYGCYISPNKDDQEFELFLNNIQNSIKEIRNEKIFIAGDFNAKAHKWGSPVEDSRGKIMNEWLEE